ncbi:MAG: thioredoxin domain-containing protein [Bdellovibrionales bacterium]|nr:thioredoxin domain-containing protein [Bdellovibrionales bacterium]
MKISKIWIAALVAVLSSGLVACAPSAPQLKKVLEDNPDVLFAAMKKDPVGFLETVNEIDKLARVQREEQQFEDGFKNPYKPVFEDSRTFEGPKDAAITIVEYTDFQCSHCREGMSVIREVMKAYEGKVRVLTKHFPIDRMHPQARKMAQLYEAMATKDKAKALEFKAKLFEDQDDFQPTDKEREIKSQDDFIARYGRRIDAELAKVVKSFGFEFAELKKLGESDAIANLVQKDLEEGQAFGFTGTPGYLVNGVPVRGAYPFETFKMVIDRVSK